MGPVGEFLNDGVWHVFLNGFCVTVVRPGIVVFLFLILCLRFGAGLGLPLLFWRPRAMPETTAGEPAHGRTRPGWVAQLFVGVGIGALLWQVVLSGYLFEEFATNFTRDRAPFCENREPWPAVPTFGGAAGTYPGRFRYDPLGFRSMWGYALVVAGGFGLIGVLGAALWVAWRVVTRVRRWGSGWAPFEPPSPRPSAKLRLLNRAVQLATGWEPFRDRSDRTPIPYSPALPAGLLLGLAVTSALTSAWFERPGGLEPANIGETFVAWGGWGESDQRLEELRKHSTGEHPLVRAGDEKWSLPERLRPYYPVYGAFTINFVLITVASLALLLVPLSLRAFSPAVGIVFLLNGVLFLNVLFNFFIAFPSQFVVFIAAGVVLAMGRAYKLRFPHLGAYYDRPVPLSALYADRAAEEANATRPGAVPAPPAPVPPLPPPAPPRVALIDSKTIPYPHPAVSGGKKPPLAIVCVSGGGSRAAAWTMRVLLEIERAFGAPAGFNWGRVPPPQAPSGAGRAPVAAPVAFPYHVRLVSGASGGMIAAAQYVASLAAPTGPHAVNRNPPFVRPRPECPGQYVGAPLTGAQLFDGMCEDYLTPIVHTMVSRDLPSLFLPVHVSGADRGRAMEDEWRATLSGQLDQTFEHLSPGEASGWRPSLIFSPMLVEDGRQLFISNLELSPVIRNTALIQGETGRPAAAHCSGVAGDLNPAGADGRRLLSREGLEFFKVFPQARDFRLSTATRMSASFPYILPAVPLPTNPPRRVVDAGYYDNYGVGIAASWLFSHMDWVRQHTSGVVVIQIRDGASGDSRRRECVFDAFPSVPAAGVQWATSPPKGLWNFRTAAQTFRNDNLLHLLDGAYRDRHTNGVPWFDPNFFTTVSFELQQGDEVALNFTLTESERQVIIDSVRDAGFIGQLAALLSWWHSR